MNKNHVEEMKREDKKAFKSYVLIVVVSAILGGIFGFMSVYLKETIGESVPNLLISIFETITPFASLVLSILVVIANQIVYTK